MFSINCLEITATKEQWEKNNSLYKNLLSDKDYNEFNEYKKTHTDASFSKRFFFNDFYYHDKYGDLKVRPKEERVLPKDFFGKNINIQAIVGKNGSGKSSLMDLMYMSINNFCYMFERGKDRPGADPLYFVPNLYVCLYFSIGTIRYKLINEDKRIKLLNNTDTHSILKKIYDVDLFELKKTRTIVEDNDDKKLKKLVSYFFYTIVSNYSMQSFVSLNYFSKVFHYNNTENNDKRLKKEHGWINPIFHKNDGYIRPIVLNPYRDNGWINLENEYELSKDRVITLFLYSQYKKLPLFQTYKFDSLSVQYDESKFTNWIYNSIKGKLNKKLQNQLQKDKEKREKAIKTFVASAKLDAAIRKTFHLSLSKTQYRKEITRYLQIKFIKIIEKYNEFALFANSITLKSKKDIIWIETNQNEFEKFLKEIIKGRTHITRKIRRTINYVSFFQANPQTLKFKTIKSFITSVKENSFYNNKKITPSLIDDCLPPPIFKYQLFLKKEGKNFSIPYNQLSSGEIQLLQTISVHTYHILNLSSVSSHRPKYQNINLVFDELEICFHPEYQRQFVHKLRSTIENMDLNDTIQFNIFLITHSPFILSDIPSSNILYLRDGQAYRYDNNKTFGANISDLCKDSFFLENGFVGDLAKEKTNSLAKFLASKEKAHNKWNKENARTFIKKIISEPIVKNCLGSLFSVKYGEEL